MLDFSVWDIAVILGYLAIMAMMGVYFSRKNSSTEEYFVGGRSFSGWVVGLSLVGTSISSVTFIAFPADAYKTTWIRFLPNFGLIIAVMIASRFILPFFRRGKITSAYEYLEHRFGPSIRLYGSLSFVIAQLVRVSIILYLVSLLIHQMTGFDPVLCIVISGCIVAFYTIIGGIDAVIWTDVIQTVVLATGSIICLAVIIYKIPGGLGEIISTALADHKLSFAAVENGIIQPTHWGLSLKDKTVSMLLLLGVVSYLTEYTGNQMVVQRYCVSRSAKEARRAMWICVGSSLPIWGFYMFLGTAMYVFFKVFPVSEAAEILGGTRPAEQILPFFIMKYLPVGIKGLVIAASLAAAMSSLDSSINSISTIGVVDIYRKYVVKDRDDRHYLKVAWVFATIAGLVMIGGAIIFSLVKSNTLQDMSNIITSVLGSGLLGIYMFGFLTQRGDARAVGFGIVCTIIFTLWVVFSQRHWLPDFLMAEFDTYYTMIIGNVIMFVSGALFSYIIPSKKKDLTNLTFWTQDDTPLE